MGEYSNRELNENNSGRRSRGNRNAAKGGIPVIRLVICGIVLAALAIAAVLSVNAKKKAEQALAESESASIEASLAEEAAKAAEKKIKTVEFEPCEIPEVVQLVQDYFDARMAADSGRLAELFGKTADDAEPELAVMLTTQADWIQSYGNVNVYAVPGLDENSRLCLVQYEIDFRRTDTLAPGVMYFYARKSPEGSYVFIDNPVSGIHEYIDAELQTDSARKMIEESNAALKTALDSDSTLALIYESFRSGEIYKDKDLELDHEQEVGLFLNPEDSILVDKSVLENIQNEAAEEASIEASLAAEDETE